MTQYKKKGTDIVRAWPWDHILGKNNEDAVAKANRWSLNTLALAKTVDLTFT